MENRNKITNSNEAAFSRRSFLKATAVGALSVELGMSLSGCTNSAIPIDLSKIRKLEPVSRVTLVRDERATDVSGRADAAIVQKMVDSAMLRFTGKPDIATAWQQFISPDDIIGLKINAIAANKGPCTNPEVVQAIVNGLTKAGVPENSIIIWDRNWEQLEKAGYRINMSDKGVRCFGTNNLGSILGKKIGFLQFDRQTHQFGKVETNFSKIFTDYCTAIINLPVLKDHSIAGITFCLKNMYGCINNPADFHDNGCNPYIADLNALPIVRARVRLNIGDCLRALYHGGPTGKPEWQWNYNGIMVGTDPVALDYTAWQIIEEKRKQQQMVSLAEQGRTPRFIETAADPQHKLGYTDPDKILLDSVKLDDFSPISGKEETNPVTTQ